MTFSKLPGFYTKSGGPRSNEGRAIASLNALRSGVYSSTMLLPNERHEDYQAFADALLEDLRPESHLMHVLAMSVIQIVWRTKRLEHFESSVLKAAYTLPVEARDLINVLGERYAIVVDAVGRMTDAVLKNGIDYYRNHLDELIQLERAHPAAWPQLSTLQSQHKFLYLCFSRLSGKDNNFEQSVSQSVSKGAGATYWIDLVQKTKAWLTRQIDDFSAYAEYERAIQKIRDQRMFRLLVEDAAARPRNELSRALQRAMAEYHRERDHFLKKRAVLLDNEPAAVAPEKAAVSSEVEDVEAVEAAGTS